MNWIAGDGNVGVGTAAPVDKLHVGGRFMQVSGLANEQAVVGGEGQSGVTFGTRNGAIQFFDVRNVSVGISNDPNAWLWVVCREVIEISDERAKSHIRGIAGALDKITQLRGVSFQWRGGSARGQTADRLGLIAQEVQRVVPEAVTVNERGAALSTSALMPLLIEAIKELKAENEQIRKELAKLSDATPKDTKPRRAKTSRKKA
jgi:CRISPR/Cas system CMR subunit Cmr4 (Cas7 group RAMP superfamily)